MDNKEKQILEQASAVLTQILRGQKAEPINPDGCSEPYRTLIDRINKLLSSLSEVWDFLLPLSKGILNLNPPRPENVLASPVKELHSQLRTLVWQVQQVAKGDYKQRVFFMGEFSQAFNRMVEALEEKDRLIREYIHHLEEETKRLRESESRYAWMLSSSTGGVYTFDPHTLKILKANEKFADMMGYSSEEILELNLHDLYADQKAAESDIKNILMKSLHNITKRHYRKKSGEIVEVDINTCWSTVEQSNIVIVSVQDVTQRNKAQEIAAKYKVLLENARDIMLFLNLDGKIIEANKAAEVAYGYSREELLSMNILDLHSVSDRHMIVQYMKDVYPGGITYETVHVRRDGSSFPVEVSAQAIDLGDQSIIGQVIRDISDRKRIEQNLQYFSTYDPLTRVPNRHVLEETYNQYFSRFNHHIPEGALLLIDVDNFKFVNDVFGHTVGDMVLIELVSTLKESIGKDHFLARMGGDEFAVLLKNVTMDGAKRIAERCRLKVEQAKLSPVHGGVSFGYTISIGLVHISGGAFEFREAISRADFALDQAKEQGRNRVFCFSEGQFGLDRLSETNKLMYLISSALEEDRFLLFFQPIVDISTCEIVHYEALMRIVDEDGQFVYPGRAIPVAERFGLMPQIDRRVIQLAFEALIKYPAIKLFVNLSGVSIGDDELLHFIDESLQKWGLDPSRLGFEITETTAVKDFARADRWIRKLREKGCRFALDDFGMGFSSFSYLQYLSVDYVKIDGSYIHDLDKNYRNRALVQAMNKVARALGKEVIAECVENCSILRILKEDQISHMQGYYLGQPAPVPQKESILGLFI